MSASVAPIVGKARVIPPSVRAGTTVTGMMSVRGVRGVVVPGVDASVSDGVIVPTAHLVCLHEVDGGIGIAEVPSRRGSLEAAVLPVGRPTT